LIAFSLVAYIGIDEVIGMDSKPPEDTKFRTDIKASRSTLTSRIYLPTFEAQVRPDFYAGMNDKRSIQPHFQGQGLLLGHKLSACQDKK